MISWGPDSSLERERKIRHRLFMFSIKREIRHFHRRSSAVTAKKLYKNSVTYLQSCCFTNQRHCFFAVLVAVVVVVAKVPFCPAYREVTGSHCFFVFCRLVPLISFVVVRPSCVQKWILLEWLFSVLPFLVFPIQGMQAIADTK